ncbi:unnamed protein product, partial [Symbiodinium sp. KB8]
MDHHDDPDDPAEVVEPPFDRRVRGRHFDGRVPKFRAPAAMLEARSWALRDFLAVTGIGVMLDTEKEAAAVAVRRLLFKPRCPVLPRLHRDVAAACLDGFDPTASQAEQYDCPQ